MLGLIRLLLERRNIWSPAQKFERAGSNTAYNLHSLDLLGTTYQYLRHHSGKRYINEAAQNMDILFSFTWRDVVDILVISILIHRLFILFRGTTALQIMLGLLLLWLCHTFAQATGLVLTSWFFQGLGAVAVLVIVVVFRYEIREVLVQTNPIRLFLGRPYEPRAVHLSEVEQAAFQLARSRTGALLVFQQQDRLRVHLREGVPLEGKFSPEIIVSIFARGSPIHDGAAIIQDGQIKLVGAYLPMTHREGLPKHYGARHRAAIGLSEMTDAVILLVSEERGEVSLVHKGEVEPVNEAQLLQAKLGRLLLGIESETKPRTRRRELLSQVAGFLLTFLLVSVFWGIYSGKQLSLINVTTAVDFRNIPENLELKRSSAENVEVQITGKRRLVSALKPDQVHAFLDLKEIGDGYHRLELNADNIELPLGMEVVRITPSTIRLDMEQRVEKKLAVQPDIVGSPPAGYQIDKIKVSPDYVKVSGPVSELRNIDSLLTEPISLTEMDILNGKSVVKVPLVLSPPSLRLLAGENKEVQVGIQFAPQNPSENSAN
ncbi:MAG: diadenylate cyclase [Syntrophobacterales bacterium]|jgi:uncharacterized protein (TIGR00159 family)